VNGYPFIQIPWLNHASLVNPAGNVVQPSATTVRNAINDYVSSGSTSLSYEKFILGKDACIQNDGPEPLTACTAPGYDSWPLVAVGSFLYRQSTMKDCSRAENLANFFYYAQADPTSKKLTSKYFLLEAPSVLILFDSSHHSMGLVLASSVNFFNDLFISLLLNFTCQGEPVNEIFEPKACNSNCSSTRIWVPIISNSSLLSTQVLVSTITFLVRHSPPCFGTSRIAADMCTGYRRKEESIQK